MVTTSAWEGRLQGACSACGRLRGVARAPSAASQRRRSQAAPSRGADRGRARTRVRFGAPYAGPLPLTMGPRHLAWAGRRLDAPQSQACQALAAPGAGGPAGPRSHRTFMPGAVRGPRSPWRRSDVHVLGQSPRRGTPLLRTESSGLCPSPGAPRACPGHPQGRCRSITSTGGAFPALPTYTS